MSISTNGQLCYGIAFPDGFDFPWEQYSETDWWNSVSGFKHSKQIYNEDGSERLPGITEKDVDAYYDEKHGWEKAHPMPVKVVNYCSDNAPMYLLCIPETFVYNCRGYTEVIDPEKLKVTDEQKQVFLDFVEKYLGDAIQEYNEYNSEKIVLELKWLLTSYWG